MRLCVRGETDGIPAALLCSLKHAHRTMFQHLYPTQHAHCRTTYTHVKKLLLLLTNKKKQLPINLKYDTCIVKSTNREEETEKIPFSGRRKTEGRVGYSDIEKAETEAARAATPGNIASVVPRR